MTTFGFNCTQVVTNVFVISLVLRRLADINEIGRATETFYIRRSEVTHVTLCLAEDVVDNYDHKTLMHTFPSGILRCLIHSRCFIELQTRSVYCCQWFACLCRNESSWQNWKLSREKVKVHMMDQNGSIGVASKPQNQSQFINQEVC